MAMHCNFTFFFTDINIPRRPAENAFLRQLKGRVSWSSQDQEFPHHVWFQFEKPKTLTKIGFSTRLEDAGITQAPKKFEVVASGDCNLFMSAAEVLLVVENAGFDKEDQAKAWMIPEAKQAPYLCIGIKVQSVNRAGVKIASVQNMIMWERRS